MHSAPIRSVSFFQALIVPSDILPGNAKLYVLGCLAECKVVNADEVGAGKVMDHAVRVGDASMANAWDQPSNKWKRSPSDTHWKTTLIFVHFF